MEQAQKNCEVHKKRSSMILYLLLYIVLIFTGYFFIKFADVFCADCALREFRRSCFTSPLVYVLIGRAFISFYGLSSLVLFWHIIRPTTIFYCNGTGFWTGRYGFIEWSNIKQISLETLANQTVICYSLRDVSKIKIPFYLKWRRHIRKHIEESGLMLKFSGTNITADDVFKVMKKYCGNEAL